VPKGQMPRVSEAVRGHVMNCCKAAGRQAFSSNLDLPSA
jgi:hypothetical protein